MPRNSKPRLPRSAVAKDLWTSPRSNLRGPDGNRAWDNQGNTSPNNGARFLELADIALGLKKPTPKKKKAAAAGTHDTTGKAEPEDWLLRLAPKRVSKIS